MTDPRRPRPERPRPGRGEIPWTPFGPGDNAKPDVPALRKRLSGLQRSLEKAQLELTEMRYGPGSDGTPPEIREVTRADGLWPFLLIRSFPGDTGARPTNPDRVPENFVRLWDCPDIIVTPSALPGGPTLVDRTGYPGLEAIAVRYLAPDRDFDIWVHVWNLGAFQASGVRVRVVQPVGGPVDTPPYTFLGAATLDLGDRLSERAHLVVKVATFRPADVGFNYETNLIATAECITDPSSGDRTMDADRHTAHRLIVVIRP